VINGGGGDPVACGVDLAKIFVLRVMFLPFLSFFLQVSKKNDSSLQWCQLVPSPVDVVHSLADHSCSKLRGR
jgi:hypothetical protein